MKRCLMAAFIKFTKRAGGGVNRGKAGGCSVHAQMKTDMVESEEKVHCRGIYEDSPGPGLTAWLGILPPEQLSSQNVRASG